MRDLDPYDGRRPGLSPELQRLIFTGALFVLIVLALVLLI